jgi:uncharacterized protein (UPF0333 family)
MNKKYLILGGVLIAIAGVGYLLYKKFVTDKVTKMATEVDQDIAQAEAMAETMVTPLAPKDDGQIVAYTTSGVPITQSSSGAPLTNAQLLQQYMNR